MTAKIKDLPIGTKVTAFIADIGYQAVIVEPPADHPRTETTVCVRFTPPVVDKWDPTGSTHFSLLSGEISIVKVVQEWPGSDDNG
jgi:hypothetical protein